MPHPWVGWEGPLFRTGLPATTMMALGAVLLLIALLAAFPDDAAASPDPPPSGDWTVGSGETVKHVGTTLDLRGDLHVRGYLELDNSTLWVWLASGRSNILTVHPGGELRLVNSHVAPQGIGRGYALRAEAGSYITMDGASFRRAGIVLEGDGRDAGVFVATSTTLRHVQFVDCLVGLWASAASVQVTSGDFVGCDYGAVVNLGGTLDILGGSFVDCQRGALCNASTLTVSDSTVGRCAEGLLAYGGDLTVSSVELTGSSILGVGAYSAELLVESSTLRDAESDGVVIHKSRGRVRDCTFSNLTADIKLIHSEAWISGNEHRDTYDEAMWMYHSTFHIEDVSTVDSYWGLRAFKSSGECTDLRTVNATYGAHLERCTDVTLRNLTIAGGLSVSRPNPRGVFATGGTFRLMDSTITDVRTGIDLLSVTGTAERVNISACAQQGVMASLSWGFTLRWVNVTDAQDGFLLTLYSGGRLEGCVAYRCRAAGFNFTSRSTTTLVECNATANPVGINALYASPTLRDCRVLQVDARGRPVNHTLGMDMREGSPDIRGGEVLWGAGGIRLNATHAVVRDVTFVGSDRWSVQVRDSYDDLIDGCRFLDLPNATGIYVYMASPRISGSEFLNVSYGITAATGSRLVIEGNTITNATWDGIWLVDNTSAETRGNLVHQVGYFAIHVMLHSSLVSRDDVLLDAGSNGIFVWMASRLDMQGGSIVNCSVGVYAWDVISIRVAFVELRDLNRGILLYKNLGRNALVEHVRGSVEGCYFANHSAYCIGAFDSEMRVEGSSMLDNMAGILALNASLTLVDCILVGSWLYGLSAEGTSSVTWQVLDRCRLISSDVTGPVSWTVLGGDLHVEDCTVTVEPGGSFVADGGTVTIRGTRWLASGSVFRLKGCTVELTNSTFVGVGPTMGGEVGTFGVSLRTCEASVKGCSFQKTRSGLALVSSNASVAGCTFLECASLGIYCLDTAVTLSDCDLNYTLSGSAIHLERSSMTAEGTTVGRAAIGIVSLGSNASFTDCGIGSTNVASVKITNSTLRFFNVVHDADLVQVMVGGRLETYWYLTARVVWPDPEELPDARVYVNDASFLEVANGTPDSGGLVGGMVILATVTHEGGTDVLGPHTVFADMRGYTVNVQVLLVSSTTVVLDLKDDDPPTFNMYEPTEDMVRSMFHTVRLVGTAVDKGAGTERVELLVDSSPTSWVAEGSVFAFNLSLSDGTHLVDLVATDLAGNRATHTITVHVRTEGIQITPPEPADGTVTRERTVLVRGRVSRTEDVTVRVNGMVATLEEDGYYSLSVDLLEGNNLFVVVASDIFGHLSRANMTVVADWTGPDLRVTSPRDINTTEDWVNITGVVDADAKVYIQGSLVLLREGRFSVKYPVYVGDTSITVRAVDDVGNAEEVEVLVFRQDVQVEPEGPNPWEVYIFLLIIPILVVAIYVVLRRLWTGGEGP